MWRIWHARRRNQSIAVVNDPPVPESNHSARECGDFIGMCDHDDRDAMSPVQLLKDFHDLGAGM